MRNGDNGLCLLPGGKTFKAYTAVFGNQILQVGAGIGNDGAVCQGGTDAAFQLAGSLVEEGGAHAEEALAAVGQICAEDEVKLAACAGNLLGACAFRVGLAEEVDIHRVVDGYEIVQLGDDAGVIGIVNRCGHAGRVVIDEVIQLLGAGAEGVYLAAPVDVFVFAVDFAGHGDIHEGIHVHLGMNAQVFQVAFRDHLADGVRHAADTKLQAGAVLNHRHDLLRNGDVNF